MGLCLITNRQDAVCCLFQYPPRLTLRRISSLRFLTLGRRFVTMRVAHAVAKYSLGLHSGPLCLAGIHMRRDWGHAEDYVRGMWLMLQQHAPDDFVCATGVAHSVQELVETAFAYIEVPLV